LIINKLELKMIHLNKEKKEFLLLGLLEKFTKKELKGLRNFVSCRYFNTDQYVVKLLEMLENELIGKQAMNETMQAQIYTRVFGEKQKAALDKKQKATFNAKMNALTRLAERFLTVEALEDDEVYKSDLLLRKLLEKRQSRLFDRYVNKIQKQTKRQQKDSQYHNQQFKIRKNELQHIHQKGKIGKTDNLNEQNHQLDLYYLFNKLELHLTAHTLRQVYPQKNYAFLNSLKNDNLLNINNYLTHPLIQIYLAAIDLTIYQNYEMYQRLFRLMNESGASVPPDKRKHFYITLVNFCSGQIKQGQSAYYRHAYDLFRVMDEKNLLLENGIMPPRKLKNIVSVAGRIEAYNWAEEIIEKYCPYVVENIREDIRHFNLGATAFYRKEYDTTKEHFNKISNRINPIYDINLRIITAKYSYELSNNNDKKHDTYIYVLPRLQSYEGYISESKRLREVDKISHKNFMRILINLFRIKHSEGKMTLEKVKEKLAGTAQINNKDWLEEKIHELETNPPKIS